VNEQTTLLSLERERTIDYSAIEYSSTDSDYVLDSSLRTKNTKRCRPQISGRTRYRRMTSSEKGIPTTMAKSVSSRPFSSLITSTFRRVYRVTKTSLALVGLGAITPLAYEYYKLKDEEKKAEQGSYVLVLPFYRMKIVERGRRFFFPVLSEDSSSPIEIGVSEVVDLIHAAALDPKVTALYGQFDGIGTQGHAHIEEIRNAIRVFNQIHRVHPNPNVHCDVNFEKPQERNPKITMAFAKSLDTDSYVLASEFE
jgi:hypothetical protein